MQKCFIVFFLLFLFFFFSILWIYCQVEELENELKRLREHLNRKPSRADFIDIDDDDDSDDENENGVNGNVRMHKFHHHFNKIEKFNSISQIQRKMNHPQMMLAQSMTRKIVA